LFARVSRGERSQTTESQLVPLRALAARAGWVVVAEVPKVCSGWDEATAAEAQAAALAPIIAGEADTLAVWALDRLTRGGVEVAFGLVRRLESQLHAELVSLQEPFLSTAGHSPEARELLLAMSAWVARWESERRSQRVKAKVVSKRTAAGNLGQRALWGRGRLATDAEVARVVELRQAGRSVRDVAREVGLPKSQVGRISLVPPFAAGQEAGSEGKDSPR
jgi:DNA invertase Pin-like site-specific DNA recombinase